MAGLSAQLLCDAEALNPTRNRTHNGSHHTISVDTKGCFCAFIRYEFCPPELRWFRFTREEVPRTIVTRSLWAIDRQSRNRGSSWDRHEDHPQLQRIKGCTREWRGNAVKLLYHPLYNMKPKEQPPNLFYHQDLCADLSETKIELLLFYFALMLIVECSFSQVLHWSRPQIHRMKLHTCGLDIRATDRDDLGLMALDEDHIIFGSLLLFFG